MGRYFALALNASESKSSSKPEATRRPKTLLRLKNPGSWLMFALFAFAAAYLFQVNSISTRGYEIKALEERFAILTEQHERLELEARSLQAIETIETETRSLNLVPASSVGYLDIESGVSYQR